MASPHRSSSSNPRVEQEMEESASLDTFVTDYKIENGRRYHAYKDGAYWGPNDDAALEGQDFTHQLYAQTLGAPFLSPLDDPRSILDIGTGTGIWAIEVADTYPDAEVIGLDLSPVQPELVPPNCVFEVDDVEMEWTWDEGRFDFVHVRGMYGSIADWEGMLKEALRSLKVGGWCEITEHCVLPRAEGGGSLDERHVFSQWGRTITRLGERKGKTFDVYARSAQMLRDAGFVDVTERKFRWPIGPWPTDSRPRELGSMNQERILGNLEGYGLRLMTQTGRWTAERAQVFMAEMRNAVRNPDVHAYQDVIVAYGRKRP